ncbi:hypothetical protein ON058_02845 [Demequina sp. B12]|uniref:hypothetical protein n=1 Tax=Demequina sp. B12 TaxID=2992757 RepID=UPI00237B843D|nr:hypothetical protein [Demequina sp. B12]MDE0572348.1 hypothetical protein [Demequina sp. B12]
MTPLPSGRNAIESVPAVSAPELIVEAVTQSTGVQVRGDLVRVETQEDGSVAETPMTFSLTGSGQAYVGNAGWDGYEVEMSRDGDSVWFTANDAYVEALGRSELAGVCLSSHDPLVAQWQWLDGPEGVLAGLLGEAQLGAPTVDESGAEVLFSVVSGGAVVGSLQVSALGDPVPTLLEIDDPSGWGTVEFTEWGEVGTPEKTGCQREDSP